MGICGGKLIVMSVCIECFCVCRSRSNASWGSENSWLADTQEVDVAAPPKPPYKTDQTCTKQLTCYLLFVLHIYSYFQLAVCFERQYIFKQFIFLCIAYMVHFNLSCMAHTLGKFTLVTSSYCVFTLFFACLRYQKKKEWDGIYFPPPYFFFIQKMKKIILSNNDGHSDIQSPSQMCSWQGSRILYKTAINSFLSPRNRDDQCMVSEDTWYQQPWLTYFFVKRQKNR